MRSYRTLTLNEKIIYIVYNIEDVNYLPSYIQQQSNTEGASQNKNGFDNYVIHGTDDHVNQHCNYYYIKMNF